MSCVCRCSLRRSVDFSVVLVCCPNGGSRYANSFMESKFAGIISYVSSSIPQMPNHVFSYCLVTTKHQFRRQADIGQTFSLAMPTPNLKAVRRHVTDLPRGSSTTMRIRIESGRSRESISVHRAGCTVLHWNIVGNLG